MKILVSDPITDTGISILEDSDFHIIYLPNSDSMELNKAIQDADGMIIRSGTKVDLKMIESSKKLQVIGRAGVGVDNIDIQAATRKGIVVMNTPDVNTISAAEHTIALMLTLSRNIHRGHMSLNNGLWNRHKLVGTELRNKTVGIVGLGKIGREVMERCVSFKMNILGYDPFVKNELFDDAGITITDLDKLTKESDYITLHIPLNDKTRNLFNYNRIKLMKPSARLINVARGGIINEIDLAKALKENVIAGAAIDVFDREPIGKEHPLVGIPNALLSPHLGASTNEAKEGVSRAICEQVRDFLMKEKLSNALNIPISNLALLKDIQPFLDLAELLGEVLGQIVNEPTEKVLIECHGTVEEIRPISLAFFKGLLSSKIPDRINYINAEAIAKELGIEIQLQYTNIESNYLNVISASVISKKQTYQMSGSVFSDNKPRLVNILGRKMEVTPKGTMLLLENDDVPGVIGRIGTLLGELDINIAAYLLNRGHENGKAFAVIRIDNALGQDNIDTLRKLSVVKWVKQIQVLP